MMYKSAVVTGATGFLGQHMTHMLLQQGVEVSIIVRDKEKAKQLFPGERVKIITGSLLDPTLLQDVPENSAIFHCAAITGSIHTNQRTYDEANIAGTRNLLNAAVARNAAHFIFVSSISAVGARGSLSSPITEDTIPDPETYYGLSKALAEQTLLEHAPEHLPLTIVRPPLIYGPGQNPRSGASQLFKLLHRKIVPVVANKNAQVALVHVHNLCQAMIDLSLNHQGKEIFNVCDHKSYMLNDLAQLINPRAQTGVRFLTIPYFLVAPLALLGSGISFLCKRDFGLCLENLKGISQDGFVMSIDKALSKGYKPDILLENQVISDFMS